MQPLPRNVKSTKSRLDTINQTQSHLLVPSEKLDKVTRRVIAPYAQIERKGLKEEEDKAGRYLDMSRFNVFLEDTVDLESLLYETAMVLKNVTDSTGVFVYIVDKLRNEIVLMHPDTVNPDRHEVNMTIREGKTAAAHVAYTKEFLLLEDVQHDRRFSEGLRWIDAKVALCMPVIKPDGDCYAVLELYRTNPKIYDDAVVKSFIGAMRSSFYIIDKDHISEMMQADMWDDGWSSDRNTMPKKKLKVKTCSCVVQLTNKTTAQPFDADDEKVFAVFVSYCSLIVHFYNMQQKKIFHDNLNHVFCELMSLHMKPCRHDMDDLLESSGVIMPPINFKSFDYHISDSSKEDMPGLLCIMFTETFTNRNFDRLAVADFLLSTLCSYRQNPYHNAEHAFCFTHTMYLILLNNPGYFDFNETAALMLAGLCHDLDHPGYNNNFLTLCKHPLASMYRTSMLENHHYFLAKKIIEGILMTTSDLSGCCKPFGIAKAIAESVYEEFYAQGDRERAMGYTPLSMMDRRRSINQPAEQIQFLSVVVLPCLLMLQNVFPNTSPLTDNCRSYNIFYTLFVRDTLRYGPVQMCVYTESKDSVFIVWKTQEAWHEEIEIRGHKLWRQQESLPDGKNSRFLSGETKSDTHESSAN
ncbi:hypothetical protein HF086_000669 [Spodoptera exigua]|uniref:Phosphodiesterase n=1 Tax=Spodoptera exigua TaxID=7107 RepID=A0A922M8N3_SPOEX|nr:hypothetical protein HF086_000669 [Spodoptera exigua]